MSESSEQRLSERYGCVWSVAIVFALLTAGAYYAYYGDPACKMHCANQCTQIALAMHNYAYVYHSLPPAYTADRDGRPLHSWRVLILPYMELGGLYSKIRLDEPWDSPHNCEVLRNTTVASFHCDSATNPENETSYVMIVGERTISDGPHSVRSDDIKDGTLNTIMFVEIKNSGIHWAEPRDLDFNSMSFRVNDPNGRGVSTVHYGGAFVTFANGATRSLPQDFDPKLLKALITINGGEDVSEFTNR